ncbi:hypothetical protein BUALT_Bualt07G0174700 [Buddleja alternifolia]|uniref:B box-type domain-containing protein n=1 Tax=Buddleja alternifolia TaxID=168488 RepID=A0AAV6XM56_9LAMI|nr:hypothetical protein BUALT_Bualt07G0174700 [Buddleja alternifolia]
MKVRSCELCNAEAAVYCTSDTAFLCWSCDLKIHDANFLVARHIRQSICSNCKNYTGDVISGVGFQPSPATCQSCPAISAAAGSISSESSVCISSTTSPAKEYSVGRKDSSRCIDSSSSSFATSQKSHQRTVKSTAVDYLKAEAIFVNWCGKLGVGVDMAVRMACSALRVLCLDRWTALPFRVSLAASMWLGLRLAGKKSLQVLKRLEEISGVPAKLILAAESKMERALRRGREQQQQRRRRRLELEEGWAEC